MKKIAFTRSNINFIFIIMFLLTFIILIITEVLLSNFYKNRNLKTENEIFSPQTDNLDSVKNNYSSYQILPKDAVWQNVVGSRYKFYVYSAYLDRRSKKQWLIRIIAVMKTKNPDKIMCSFHYENRNEHIPAKIKQISENWSLPYSAVFIMCHLKNFSDIPVSVFVSVYNRSSTIYTPASNNMIVNNRNMTDLTLGKNKNKIAVCVKPIHFNYDKSIELIEYIELNRLLGVHHFTFYNSSTGPSVNCVLQEYQKQGIISVLPWELGIKSKIEIRTEGMFAALNDCLYRNMYVYPYAAFVDIDEFIVPHFNSTLIDLIEWLSVRYNVHKISSFSFQNAFFYLQWADDANIKFGNEIENRLVTMRKTRRCVKLNAHKQRSKYIAKLINVVEVGNHFVWQFFSDHSTLNVPPDMAILNHYRVCEFGGDDCVRLLSTVDRTLYRYRKLLTCKVAQKWLPLIDKCNLPKINSFNLDKFCKR